MKGIVRGREYLHIFFLADAGEEDITDALNRAKLQALGWTGLCLGLSLLLAVGKL